MTPQLITQQGKTTMVQAAPQQGTTQCYIPAQQANSNQNQQTLLISHVGGQQGTAVMPQPSPSPKQGDSQKVIQNFDPSFLDNSRVCVKIAADVRAGQSAAGAAQEHAAAAAKHDCAAAAAANHHPSHGSAPQSADHHEPDAGSIFL